MTLFGTTYPAVDAAYHPTLLKSTQILSASMNNHLWVGGLSQFDYKVNDYWKTAGGLDYRWYKGTHYTEIVDLLGGDYYVNMANENAESPMKVEGDKIAAPNKPYQNHRDGFVQWAGGFGQAEYKRGRWSAFINLSGVVQGYRGVDYFQKKVLDLGDTILRIGYKDTIVYNGKEYNASSEGLKYYDTGWKWLYGGTFKMGANFNIDERNNVFFNTGYLNRTPQFSNVVDNNTNEFFEIIENEKIYAFEIGYGFRSEKFSGNLNAYYTIWENKPFPYGVKVPDPQDPTEFIRANVAGMDALHMGLEVDAVYRVTRKLTLEGMISLGDWTWQSSEIVDVVGTQIEFDAKGVHVGNSAQNIYASSVRYAFVKNAYIKAKYTYFDKYYSDFDPFSLTGSNGGKESWKLPSYGLLSLHAGYRFKFEKFKMNVRANVFNVLDTKYISDARNNQFGSQTFDANSAGVFMGQGLRFNVSLGIEF